MKPGRTAICLFVTVFFSLIVNTFSFCQERPLFASELRGELSSVLGRSLPPLEDMLPGLRPIEKNPPSLCVGFLKTESGDNLDWGGTIGTILRWKTTYTPRVVLISPPVSSAAFQEDFWIPGTQRDQTGQDLESLALSYDLYGIRHALTGKASIGTATFQLDLQLWKLPSREEEKFLKYQGPLDDLPRFLSEAAHAILDAIGIKLDEKSSEYVSALTPASLGQLQEFVSVWTKANQGNEEGALSIRGALWNEATNLPMLSLPYCFALTDNKESLGDDYILRLRAVQERFPDHSGVKWVVAKFLPAEGKPEIAKEKLELRKSAAQESPMDPLALGAYAESLYEEGKDVLGAIAVLVGSLEEFPRNYRFWWSLGYILNRAAADTRGTSLYADINPEDREKFPALNAFASSAIDRGLQINPNSAGLWHMKMKVIGIESGSSPEFMAAFDKAISIDPTFSSPYLTAVYALMPQWGGSIENQIHVLVSAYRNIPDNMWIITKLFRQFNETLERLELDPGQSAQDLVRWAKDIRDPAILVGIKKNSTDDLLFCYKTFLRCKDRDNALTVFYQIIKTFKESMSSATPRELQQVEELLSLGDSNEANIMLDLIGKMLKVKSAPGDDYLISLRALVNARGGKVDDALATLKSRIQASRENEFSRLRYLELGMDQSLDSELRNQCLADLCPSPTGEVDYRAKYGDPRTFIPPDTESPRLNQLLSDYMGLLAKGHMAAARKDSQVAVNFYLQAASLSKYINNTSLDAAFPSYFVHLWREYRELAKKEKGQ